MSAGYVPDISDSISNVQPVPRNGRGRELFKTPNDAVQVQSLSGSHPKELLVGNFHQGLQRSAAHNHAGFPVPFLDATKSLLHRVFDLLRHFRSPAQRTRSSSHEECDGGLVLCPSALDCPILASTK